MLRRLGRPEHLLHGPLLARLRIALDGVGSEGVEGLVVRRVHCHQLTLQMGAELGDLDAVGARCAGELVAIGLRRRRLLQVDQPRVPRGQLHALEAVAGGPLGDRVPRVERCRVGAELREIDAGALDVARHGWILRLDWK
jgi:hypothetical protein